ncbi:hypothetical protein [Nonomuraea sp. NPDC049480]|uniref:hypothetical protein n=1 Tax=Nonomuraea sp. NPDC049480 TaxID=3364353 RepID=UPI0037A329E5
MDNVTFVGQAPVWALGKAEDVPKTTDFGAACAPKAKAPDARAITATSPPIRRPALADKLTGFLPLILDGGILTDLDQGEITIPHDPRITSRDQSDA